MDASRVQLYRAFLALDSVGLQRSQIGEERILGGKEWCLLSGQLKVVYGRSSIFVSAYS